MTDNLTGGADGHECMPRRCAVSNKVQSWVWDESRTTGNDRIVLLKLADEAGSDGASCWPSIRYLAAKCRIDRATVLRCIVRLEDAGEILVSRPERYGRGRHNRYIVVMGRDVDELVAGADEDWSQIATFTVEAVKVAEGRVMVAQGARQVRPDPRPHTPETVRPRSDSSFPVPREPAPSAWDDEPVVPWSVPPPPGLRSVR